ncbi:Rieske (2Fe-2S) protein [candidate division KSB1 bacterium]|nr:Rieske (2Fe-2S) protein [candidate division KSB1 bacterium]NIR68445.1 Rieske (2Fe-2S) protein [candidate division KSB1 bacterium]NIS22677.1 Rieske (2Fe-2S) protein [candidate division KSB1 bacterium]NIT72274.1 Rieske (2Fe-2S) protein [candidate division KSB1 bacterium]NIU28633.1 Rieske (2Fe-2S) protein [candidate division KSB1 bacterium]
METGKVSQEQNLKREDSQQSQGVPRRKIVNLLLGGGLLTTLGSILVPLINFIIPPKVQEAAQNSVVAAKVGELPLNSGKIFRFGSKPGILVHTQNDEYVAFSAICTHLDCTVQYRQDFKHIWCACHNGHFDLTGKNISGPPPRPLEAYKVDIREEDIVVSRSA